MRSSLSRVSFGLVCLVLACGDAFAQTPHELVPVFTGQSNIPLSRKHGAAAAVVSNDAGDSAYFSELGAALFYRKAGKSVAVRAIQYGDELPGLPGSRLAQIFTIFMNSSGLLVARADVLTLARVTNVIFTFDGTTIQTLVTGPETAPGTGGARFERAMSLIDVNDNGDVLFGSTLLPQGSTATALPTVFLKPFASVVIRVAGPGDASPGTGGAFAGQPLSRYFMRTFVLTPWSSAMISFYPATNDNQWFTLDNVAMNITPSAPTFGTDCEEPGDTSTLGGGSVPGGSLADAAAAIRPEMVHDRFARVMQRLMSQATHQQ